MMNTRRKMRATEWQETFTGKPPSMPTIKKWIEDGELEGEIIGTTAFVYVDKDQDLVNRINP